MDNKKLIIPSISKDLLWKSIIEELFVDFLHYFFPDFIEEVDFTKPYEFLDKELQQIIPASESKHRRADLLVKVYLKNGKDKWILIHTEVQGYEDKDFPLRMYTYNYRTFDRFNRDVVAIAILTDENPNFRPSHYERTTWDTKIRYDYKMFKLLDYEEAHFINSKNPFASVLLTARSYMKNNTLKTDEDLLSLKIQLFRTMFEQGHDKKVIRSIANFIKLYVTFQEPEYFVKFENVLNTITKNHNTMGIEELFVQEAIRVNREDAMQIGMEKARLQEHRRLRNRVAKNLFNGYSIEEISNFLDISVDEVHHLKLEIHLIRELEKGVSKEVIIETLNVTKEQILAIQKTLEISESEN